MSRLQAPQHDNCEAAFSDARIDELLERLQSSVVCSSLDFTGTFLQTRMHPDDRHKTVFRTRSRKLKYTCVSFELVNATPELQQQGNHHFSGSINEGWTV